MFWFVILGFKSQLLNNKTMLLNKLFVFLVKASVPTIQFHRAI